MMMMMKILMMMKMKFTDIITVAVLVVNMVHPVVLEA
jgi:hypothetical protein